MDERRSVFSVWGMACFCCDRSNGDLRCFRVNKQLNEQCSLKHLSSYFRGEIRNDSKSAVGSQGTLNVNNGYLPAVSTTRRLCWPRVRQTRQAQGWLKLYYKLGRGSLQDLQGILLHNLPLHHANLNTLGLSLDKRPWHLQSNA